jgi:hypothetical protein
MLLEADSHLRKRARSMPDQGDVLEVLDKFGCAEQIHAEGVTWHIARTYVRTKIRTTMYPQRIGRPIRQHLATPRRADWC